MPEFPSVEENAALEPGMTPTGAATGGNTGTSGGFRTGDPRLDARLEASLGGGDPMAGVPTGEVSEEEIARTGKAIGGLIGGSGGNAPAAETGSMSKAEAFQVLAQLSGPGKELTEEEQARLKAANDVIYGAKGTDQRLAMEDRLREAMGQQAQAKQIKADWEARQPADWKLHTYEQRGGEAELTVRTGDIDNLGFGWPVDFDPFSGAATPAHSFPWIADPEDPEGTDRIMVISGYKRKPGDQTDGYTERTRFPSNAVKPVTLTYDPSGISVHAARLQIFVDDFQAASLGNHFHVWINGREIPYMAEALNTLRQRGPIGKLVTFEILPEQLDLVSSGKMEILIDDPYSDIGDGFSIDFVRLLINPGEAANVGTVGGTVTDKQTGKPVGGVLVSAAGVVEGVTGADGLYRLEGVPAGLAVITASHSDYQPASDSRDLLAGDAATVDLQLEPRDEQADSIEKSLQGEGRIDLYGILFDTNEATIKPESEETLTAVLNFLQSHEDLVVRIVGHTDSVGSAEANRVLSERRAQAVVDWLVDKGISGDRVSASGSGESQPVASNETEEGRARNRRVELAIRR